MYSLSGSFFRICKSLPDHTTTTESIVIESDEVKQPAMASAAPAAGLHKPCPGCQTLVLKTMIKCADLTLKSNLKCLDEQELSQAYLETPPLVFNIERLKAMISTCSMCRLLYTEIAKAVPANAEFVSMYRYEELGDKLACLWMYPEYGQRKFENPLAMIYCYADEGQLLPKRDVNYDSQANSFAASFASQYVELRPISPAGSQASMATIKNWLKECEDDHPQCRSSLSGDPIQSLPDLPTRVIDITLYPHSLRLVVSGGRRAKYVAVSHCWGGHSPIRTTRSTLDEHLKHISPRALSKTIQDAVYITHSLGIRYLWVDYLCIIQEDDEDFDRESRTMASVYERASCTIAATAARDGTEGCFQRTPPPQALVEVRCDPNDPASGVMYFGLKESFVEDNMFNGPLNRRGWVLQEHLFSRRTIHFAADQMYWECGKIFVGEDHSNAKHRADMYFPTRSLLSFVDDLREFRRTPEKKREELVELFYGVHTHWTKIVMYYTRCGLTRPEDKLPAILSLSLALGAILGHPFHEGHYFDNSPLVLSGLLWWAYKDSILTRPSQNRAPSWSWASVDGPIEFTVQDYGKPDGWHPDPSDLRILRVADHRPAGLPPCRALLVSGISLECSAHEAFQKVTGQDDPVTRGCGHGCQSPRVLESFYTNDGAMFPGWLQYDVAEDRPCRFWLINVYVVRMQYAERTPVYYVLMVKPAPGHPFKGRIFQRVGQGLIKDSKWTQNLDSKFMALI